MVMASDLDILLIASGHDIVADVYVCTCYECKIISALVQKTRTK